MKRIPLEFHEANRTWRPHQPLSSPNELRPGQQEAAGAGASGYRNRQAGLGQVTGFLEGNLRQVFVGGVPSNATYHTDKFIMNIRRILFV